MSNDTAKRQVAYELAVTDAIDSAASAIRLLNAAIHDGSQLGLGLHDLEQAVTRAKKAVQRRADIEQGGAS